MTDATCIARPKSENPTVFFLQEEVEEAEILKKFAICNVSCKGMEGTTSCLDMTIFLAYDSHLPCTVYSCMGSMGHTCLEKCISTGMAVLKQNA